MDIFNLLLCLQAMHAGFDFSRARIAIDLWLVTDLLPYMYVYICTGVNRYLFFSLFENLYKK